MRVLRPRVYYYYLKIGHNKITKHFQNEDIYRKARYVDRDHIYLIIERVKESQIDKRRYKKLKREVLRGRKASVYTVYYSNGKVEHYSTKQEMKDSTGLGRKLLDRALSIGFPIPISDLVTIRVQKNDLNINKQKIQHYEG